MGQIVSSERQPDCNREGLVSDRVLQQPASDLPFVQSMQRGRRVAFRIAKLLSDPLGTFIEQVGARFVRGTPEQGRARTLAGPALAGSEAGVRPEQGCSMAGARPRAKFCSVSFLHIRGRPWPDSALRLTSLEYTDFTSSAGHRLTRVASHEWSTRYSAAALVSPLLAIPGLLCCCAGARPQRQEPRAL